MTANDATVNYNALTLGMVSLCGLLAGMLVSLFIAGGGDNPMAIFAVVLGTVFFVLGAVSPRNALFCLIPITFFLDFAKRLLIIFTNLTWDDIASVLAVAPLATVGVLVGCVLRRIFIRRPPQLVERVLFIGGAVLAFGGSIGALGEASLFEAMKVVANNSVYYFLPWAIYQCFETREQIERYLRIAALVAVPVAAYGIWQFFFGLLDFEVAYVKSGFAPHMAFTMYDVKPRPFSTMSSPHAYSSTISFMMVIAFYFAFRRQGFSTKWIFVFLVLLMGLATSTARGAFLSGLAMLALSILFTSRSGTKAGYLGSAAFIGALVLNAEALLDRLEFWQKFLPSEKAWQEQAFRITTISDRLMGYKNVLANPSAWPLIANPLKYNPVEGGADLYTHDHYSEIILKFGILPVLAGGILAGIAAYKIHCAVFRMEVGQFRNLGAALVSIAAGFFLAMSGGGGLSVFPLNFWIGAIGGFIVVMCFRESSSVTTDPALRALQPPASRPFHPAVVRPLPEYARRQF